jgi:hypothetical protein
MKDRKALLSNLQKFDLRQLAPCWSETEMFYCNTNNIFKTVSLDVFHNFAFTIPVLFTTET